MTQLVDSWTLRTSLRSREHDVNPVPCEVSAMCNTLFEEHFAKCPECFPVVDRTCAETFINAAEGAILQNSGGRALTCPGCRARAT